MTSSRRSVIGAWEKGTKQHTARVKTRAIAAVAAGRKEEAPPGREEGAPPPPPPPAENTVG